MYLSVAMCGPYYDPNSNKLSRKKKGMKEFEI